VSTIVGPCKMYLGGVLIGEVSNVEIVTLDIIAQPDAYSMTPNHAMYSVSLPFEVAVDAPVFDLGDRQFREATEYDYRQRIRAALDFNWNEWLKQFPHQFEKMQSCPIDGYTHSPLNRDH